MACHDDDDDEGRHQEPGAVRLCDTLLRVPVSPVISTITDSGGHLPHLQEYDYSTVSYCPYSGSGVGPTLVLSHLCYADFIIDFVCHTHSHGQAESALLSSLS